MIDTLGLDHYEISLSPLMIARRCHQHGLSCYLLESKGKTTCFSMRIVDRKQVEILFPQAVLIYTSGVLGMLIRTLTKKEMSFPI